MWKDVIKKDLVHTASEDEWYEVARSRTVLRDYVYCYFRRDNLNV